MVRRNQITDAGLGYLTDLCGLRSLKLEATRVTDAGLLQHLPEMPQLQELSLACLDVTDAGLAALESLGWLERISLRHTAISNKAIVEIVGEKAHSLQRLDLSNTVVNDAALADFLDRSQLRDLSLIDTGITDAACQHIARCEWLTDLRLDLTDVTDDGVRDLANCKYLQSLELCRTRVTDTSLVWLSDTRVEHLGLSWTSVTDAGIPAMTDFSTLRSLDLQGTAVTDKGLRFLSQAPHIDRLHLESTRISSAGLESLLSLPLESLSLNPRVNDTGLKMLCQHETLRHLAIWKAEVTGWQPLTTLDHLEILLIDDSVTDLAPLQMLHQLKVLLLWGNRFSPTELAKLRLSLPKCQIKTFEPYKPAINEFRNLVRGR